MTAIALQTLANSLHRCAPSYSRAERAVAQQDQPTAPAKTARVRTRHAFGLQWLCALGVLATACLPALAAGDEMPLIAPETEEWLFMVGAGAGVAPSYPGSSASSSSVVPVFGATRGRFMVGALPGAGIPFGLGFNFVKTSNWRAGLAIGPRLGKARDATASAQLRAWGDVAGSSSLAGFTTYTQPLWAASGQVVTGLGGGSQPHGTRATLALESRYRPTDGVLLTAGPGLTWADTTHQQTFFGISGAQSAASGLPQFSARSGVQSVNLAFGAQMRLSPQLGLGARATFARLQGDAARSPVTVSATQRSLSVFAVYGF